MVQSQYTAVLVGQYWALVVASVINIKKIYGLHGVNHQIIQHSEKKKMMTDKQTEFPIKDSVKRNFSSKGVKKIHKTSRRTLRLP